MSLKSNRGRAYKEGLLPAHRVTYNWGPNISLTKNTAYYLHFFKIESVVVGQGHTWQRKVDSQGMNKLCLSACPHYLPWIHSDVRCHLTTLDVLFLQTTRWDAGVKIPLLDFSPPMPSMKNNVNATPLMLTISDKVLINATAKRNISIRPEYWKVTFLRTDTAGSAFSNNDSRSQHICRLNFLFFFKWSFTVH